MKKIMLLFMVLLVIFAAGCEREEGGEDTEGPYIGGAKGMYLNFEPGTPVSEFGEDDVVDLKIKLINKGESEIPANAAMIKLYGVSPNEFNTLDFDYDTVAPGFYPAEKGIFDEGGEAIVDVGQIDYAGVISGFVERELFAKVCYPYKTMANVEACVTSKKTEETGAENICSYSGEKIEEGLVSSGPIQITTFTEELRGINQVSFKIGFQNKGQGKVYTKEESCSDELEKGFGNEGKIYVEFKPETLECSFSGGLNYGGYLTLNGNQEKILVCTLTVEEDNKYTQGIDISAEYNYVESTSTSIKILGSQ
jgi:hypothetical protein